MRTIKAAHSLFLAPLIRQRVNRWRYTIDFALLLLLRVFVAPLVPLHGAIAWVVSIYTFAAWFTILTLHPAHLPDFSTTRLKQKQAWRTGLLTIPLFLACCWFLLGIWGAPILAKGVHFSFLLSLLLPTLMDELLFRSVLPTVLRRWGLSRWLVQILQSLLFTLPFTWAGSSSAVLCTAFLLSLHNGWLAMRTRTFWPGFTASLLWRILFLV